MFVLGIREEHHERMTSHVKSTFWDLLDMALRYEALEKKKPIPVAPIGGNASGNNSNKRKLNLGDNKGEKFKNISCYLRKQKGHISRSRPNCEAPKQQNGPISPMVLKSLCFNCH